MARGGGRALPSSGCQEQVRWSGHTPCSPQGAGFLGKQLGAARALHDSALTRTAPLWLQGARWGAVGRGPAGGGAHARSHPTHRTGG